MAILLCVLMLASIAAGCAKQTPEATTTSSTDARTTNEEVTLKVYTHRTDREQDGSYAKYIAAFNEKYPNIHVHFLLRARRSA